MQLSVLILLLGLVALLLGAENSKKMEKNAKHSQKKKRNLWLMVDSTLINQTDPQQISTDQSLSPWTYEDYYEKSRIPEHISEAKCDRVGCITTERQENVGLESKPIYYQILVLRKVKVKKKYYSIQLEKRTISVGCTCVRPHVIRQ